MVLYLCLYRFATILAFDVKVAPDVRELAEKSQVAFLAPLRFADCTRG